MSDELVDMLVAHETGHALHTPAGESPILSAIREIDPNEAQFNAAKLYINVVEDIRIERMIKDEFPGVKRAFAKGYRELFDRNFFDLNAIPMEKRTLADRINIHAKIGHLVSVPFSDYERGILEMCENARSWREVIEAAKEAYQYDGTQGKSRKMVPEMNSPEENDENDNSGMEEVEVETNGTGNGLGADGSDQNTSNSTEKTESNSEKTENRGNSSANSAGEDQNDSESQETEDRTSNPDPRPYESPEFAPPAAPASADAMERNLTNSTSYGKNTGADREYGNLPTISDLDALIIDHREIRDACALMEKDFHNRNDLQVLDAAYAKMVANTNRQVNVMAREFERRRAALANRRETRSTSGSRLDVNRLHAYRYSEDLFRAMVTRRDGKSHGLVMFVDWSGSMSSVIGDTVNQAILLATFCRKANIPFEIYAFSSVDPREIRNAIQVARDFPDPSTNLDPLDENKSFWNRNPGDLVAYQFSLLNLLSSRMNRAAFNAGCRYLLMLSQNLGSNQYVVEANNETNNTPSNTYVSYRNAASLFRPNSTHIQRLSYQLNLGSTPLNSCITSAFTILPKFRAATKAQIVTAIFLTDGGASDSIMTGAWDHEGKREAFYSRNPYGYDVWMRTPRSRKGHRVMGQSSQSTLTAGLLNALRAETGCRILGFDILHCTWRGLKNNYAITKWFARDYDRNESSDNYSARIDAVVEEGKRENFVRIGGKDALREGYDETYLFVSSSLAAKTQDNFSDLESDATITKIRNAYMKQAAGNAVNRGFVTRFVEQIATAL
jgi:hypothetical protein